MPTTAHVRARWPPRFATPVALERAGPAASRPWRPPSSRGCWPPQIFDLPQAFLAPWAALLVVHATVYRTFSRGLQPGHRRRARRAAGLGRRQPAGDPPRWRSPCCCWPGCSSARALVPRRERRRRGDRADRAHDRASARSDQVLLDRLLDTAIGIGVGLAGQHDRLAADARLLPPPVRSTPSTTRSAELLRDMATACATLGRRL